MRVFIAIEISNKEILKRIETFQKNAKVDAKPTRVDQIHFTLQFLGEINEEKCKQIKGVLNEISFSQFDVSLKNVGAFPNFKNPRVIWIGIEKDGGKKLMNLATAKSLYLVSGRIILRSGLLLLINSFSN